MIQDALMLYQDQVQSEVLNILEPGNEFLEDLVDAFGRTRRDANKALVACFYESELSNVGAVVGRQERMVSHSILWAYLELSVNTENPC